jgi:hypothetical protein
VTFRGAKIKEGGVNCAVVIVPRHVIVDQVGADRMISTIQNRVFRNIAVVLMAEDPQGTPIYYGRADAVRFLESVDVGQIPWVEYTTR